MNDILEEYLLKTVEPVPSHHMYSYSGDGSWNNMIKPEIYWLGSQEVDV